MITIPRHRKQGGIALLFALLTLVAMMLATLALVRSVDTSTILLGNIAFKQDATSAADQASRVAIDWISGNIADLTADGHGYYARTMEFDDTGAALDPIDVTGTQLPNTTHRQLIDWDSDGCKANAGHFSLCTVTPSDDILINGNTARYVIFRMCNKKGDNTIDSTINCQMPGTTTSTAPGRGDFSYTDPKRLTLATGAYYRVVVRVQGARNTTSFTETLVHL